MQELEIDFNAISEKLAENSELKKVIIKLLKPELLNTLGKYIDKDALDLFTDDLEINIKSEDTIIFSVDNVSFAHYDYDDSKVHVTQAENTLKGLRKNLKKWEDELEEEKESGADQEDIDVTYKAMVTGFETIQKLANEITQ